MKNRIISIFVAFICLACNVFDAQGQINRTLETKVVDALAQMPVNDQVQLDRVMQEVLEMGEEGILEFTNRLVPLGKGNDTQARYLLHSLATYSGAQEATIAESNLVENAFIKAIEAAADQEVKIFLIDRLSFCGSNSSVAFLKDFLHDSDLFKPTLVTLTNIGTSDAAARILDALDGADEIQKRAFIKALGDLHYKKANDALLKISQERDLETVRFALMALAEIAAEESHKTLLKASKASGFKSDEKEAIIAYIHFGNRLYSKGNLDLSAKVAHNLLKYCNTQDQLHFRSVGIRLLTDIEGAAFNKTLIKEVTNSDEKYRGAVLEAAQSMITENEINDWISACNKASDEAKPQIIRMIGRENNEVVLNECLIPSLANTDETIKIAAIKSLVYQDKSKSLPLLLETLKGRTSLNENIAIEETLLRICNSDDIETLSNSIIEQELSGKVVLVHVLDKKHARGQFDLVSGLLAEGNNDIDQAVYASLKNISTDRNLEDLLKILNSVEGEVHITAVQEAIIYVLDQSGNEHNDQILRAYESADKKERILPVLVALPGDEAISIVAKVYESGSDSKKALAIETMANWRNNDAIPYLFHMMSTADNQSIKSRAYSSYLDQVVASTHPDDQKLLLIKKVAPYHTSVEEKAKLINASRSIKTFLSLVYVSEFLTDDDLVNQASGAAVSIALPSPTFKGLSGDIVKDIVSRSINNLDGPDSQYLKIDVKEFLDNLSNEKGFIAIFNGKDLNGWQGLVEDPIKRAKMSSNQLAKQQDKADGEMRNDWLVENGNIKFVGEGFKNICTIKKYADFEMLLDWKIGKGGDSGVYLRGTPQVQIWDTALIEVGAQVGSGGLYNNAKNESKPLVVADNPVNDWNTFRIKMEGEQVSVYLNGQLVVDDVLLENYWNREIPVFTKEAIELQAHGENVEFRNVFVKELSKGEIKLSAEEQSNGFVSLFNGKDLDQWQGNKKDYLVEHGELVVRPLQGGHGNLISQEEYTDFIFRFEFQLTEGANNGFGFHAPLDGDVAYDGKESQILDNTAAIYANLEDYQYHASVYGVLKAKKGSLNPVGQWNEQEIMVTGDDIKITLNGTVILDGNMKDASKNGTLDGKDHPGLKRNKGYIAFLGHGSELKFRNIRIKDLNKY